MLQWCAVRRCTPPIAAEKNDDSRHIPTPGKILSDVSGGRVESRPSVASKASKIALKPPRLQLPRYVEHARLGVVHDGARGGREGDGPEEIFEGTFAYDIPGVGWNNTGYSGQTRRHAPFDSFAGGRSPAPTFDGLYRERRPDDGKGEFLSFSQPGQDASTDPFATARASGEGAAAEGGGLG